jgi:putative transposase
VKGRKRQIVTDTLGLLVCALVHPANVADKVAIHALMRRIPFTSRLARLVVDAGYDTPVAAHRCHTWLGMRYEVVPRLAPGFQLLARRWVIERTFAWLGKYRRLSKDYEQLPAVSETFLYIASIHLMVRRLAKLTSY